MIGSVTPFNEPDTDTAAPDATDVDDLVVPSSPKLLLFEIATTPVDTVVQPVYVFAFDNVNVPAPVLVSVIEPDIAPEIVDVPAESIVNPLLPDTAPDTTNVAPESTCTSAADPPTATVPDQVTEPDVT